MLDALRRSTGSWLAKIFIGLLVLSFAVWGVADIFGGYGEQTVATVGNTEIPAEEFRNEFQREIQGLSNRLGRNLSIPDARSMGLDSQILLRMIGDAAILNQAKNLNLGVTGDAVGARLAREDVFKDSSGNFSREKFYRVLYANNLTEQVFLLRQRRALIQEQVTASVTASDRAPDVLLEAVNTFRNETRTLRHFTVPLASVGEIGEPTEDKLRAYYDSHKSEFRAPERRKAGLIVLSPEELARTADVSEEEIRSYYENNKDRFGSPELRSVLQMTFPDEGAASEAYEKLQGGADFMDVAKSRGLTKQDVELGKVRRSDLVDSKVAGAVFSLEEGEVSEPVTGDLTTVIAKVTEIEPATRKTFEEARDTIRKTIAAERAAGSILDIYDKIEDERAAGARLSEVAQKLGLEYVEPPAVDRSGLGEDGEKVEALADNPNVLRGIFGTDVGVETDPEETSGRGFIWYEVLDVTPEQQKPFEEVRSEVERKWRENERRVQLSEKVQGLVDRLRGGESLADVAAEFGAELKETGPVKRNASEAGVPRPVIQQAFALKEGDYGSGAGPEGKGRVVFQVTKTDTPQPVNGEEREKMAEAFAPEIGDDLVVQYIRALRDEFGVNINRSVLENVTSGGSAS